MTTNAESSEKLEDDIKRVVRDSEQLLRDSAGAVGGKAYAVRERLAEALKTAKATYRRIEEKAKEGAKASDRVVREHPYQSIGVAFGIGLLVGICVMRRQK